MQSLGDNLKLASKLRIIGNAILLILDSPLYIFIALLMAFLMISFMVLIMNVSLIFSPIAPGYTIFDRIVLVFNLLGGLFTNNTLISASLIIITSLLAGINVALLAIKIKSLKAVSYKESGLSSSGTIASVMATGCSSCGISILSLLGIAGGLTFLPFGGIELGFIGLFLLLFSIYWTSKSILECKICKVY